MVFVDNQSLSGAYELFQAGEARGLIIHGTLKSYHPSASDLNEYTTELIKVHSQLRAQLNVPPMLLVRLPAKNASHFPLIKQFIAFLTQTPKFSAFARYLRVNKFLVAMLNLSDAQTLVVRTFNNNSIRVNSEAQALTKYSAWAEEYLNDPSQQHPKKLWNPRFLSRIDRA